MLTTCKVEREDNGWVTITVQFGDSEKGFSWHIEPAKALDLGYALINAARQPSSL